MTCRGLPQPCEKITRTSFGLFFIVFHVLFVVSASGQIPGMDAEFAGAGARAMAMGSAFIGLADDATASEYNPAGLQNLRRPELALQIGLTDERRTEYRSVKSFANGLTDPVNGTFEDTYGNLSFAALTIPTRKLTFSLYHHSPIYLERNHRDEAVMSGVSLRYNRRQRASLRNYGLSLACSLNENLYIGVTGKVGRFSYEEKDSTGVNDKLTDYTLGANAGVLWKAHRCFSVGAVYKTSQDIDGKFEGRDIDLKIPRTIGAGVAFHPNDRFRMAADIDRADWSDYDETLQINQGGWKRNDATRYHIGGEYMVGFWNDRAVFLRAGYMLEESNARYYDGNVAYRRKAAPEPDDIHHYTCGFGLAQNRFQWDCALDYSELKTQYLLSAIFYF